MAFPRLSSAPGVRRQLLALALLCCAVSSQAAESVQALRYGVTLYHLYQQEYFDALSELLVARQLDELGVHATNAELMRGGISLSYGMDREAGRIFNQLLNEPGETVDRDRAWFYLAKMAWQRGDSERTAAALAHIDAAGSTAPAGETAYLQTMLSLHAGDEAAAGARIASLPEDSPWRAYYYYNRGAREAAAGNWRDAAGYFHGFEALEITSEEQKALRDRAYTAAGYALIAAGEFEAAGDDFRRVRLLGPMSERALLGHGWAASETGDYEAALSPWMVLSERSAISPSVREGLLAIPYAYEQLHQGLAAFNRYGDAARVFEQELAAVNAAIEQFSAGDLLSLLELKDGEADDWLFGDDLLPLNAEAPYLQHLVTRYEFQAAMRELRDLYRIDRHLADARERLQVLVDVDAEQQRSWATVIEGHRGELLEARYTTLRAQIGELENRLQSARAADDGRALADADRLALWQRVERATQLAERLDASAEQREQLRLYRGLLLWEDSEQFPANLWRTERELAELGQLAAQARSGIERLEQTVAQRRESDFQPRINALTERVSSQRERVQLAMQVSESEIRRVAVAELQDQAGQLARALGYARLGVARLYDRASTGQVQ